MYFDSISRTIYSVEIYKLNPNYINHLSFDISGIITSVFILQKQTNNRSPNFPFNKQDKSFKISLIRIIGFTLHESIYLAQQIEHANYNKTRVNTYA